MKTLQRGSFLLLLSVLCLFSTNNIFGQQQQQQRPTLLVGVIDLPSVLKGHPAVTDDVPLLEKQVQVEMAKLTQVKQGCQKQMEQLQGEYKIGSEEYENSLRPIRDQVRAAEIEFQEKQADAMAQLSKIQYKVFQDVQKAVENVAVQNGIIVVHMKVRMDRKNVSEEVAALQEADANTVVWNHPNCDITDKVKTQLAQTVGTAKTKAGGPLENIASGNVRPSGPQQQSNQQPAIGNNLNNGLNNNGRAVANQPSGNRLQ